MNRHVVLLLANLLLLPAAAPAAEVAPIDVKMLGDLSLRALASMTPRDRQGARAFLSKQIGLLPRPAQTVIVDTFMRKYKTEPDRVGNDILAVFKDLPSPWTTNNTQEDIQFLYQRLTKTDDDIVESLLDDALANASGLYRDGIAKFNTLNLASLAEAEPLLRTMADQFPKSKYAERANFYLAQTLSKRAALNDPDKAKLLSASNVVFEQYIARAEKGYFDNRKDYLAAGYYYRALNGWMAEDLRDAKKWLTMGKEKFPDTERVYVYQLFPSREKAAVIDKFLPAKIAFSSTLDYLNQQKNPFPATERSMELVGVFASEKR